ncbi:MAG: hypothetical protein N2508_02960 [Anaerolineae bacterium]|nr:hypothetical protein [Anaerolineae bacterium]
MSPELPPFSKLSVEHLAACFNNVTNSYKFYWLLAILECVQSGRGPLIPLSNLLAEMVAAVWYPTNYFRLSFGKQDRLGALTLQLGAGGELPLDASKDRVKTHVLYHLESDTELGREIRTLGRFVPYRFLRPFFATELHGRPDSQVDGLILRLSAERFAGDSPCFYRFVADPQAGIEIHPVWWPTSHNTWPLCATFACGIWSVTCNATIPMCLTWLPNSLSRSNAIWHRPGLFGG